jgi:hypothetical protein
MQEFPRDFKGIWIPRELWQDHRLTFFEKCLLAEIDSLDHPETHCYASNQYFASLFNVSERTIQASFTKLKNLNLIEQISFDGRTRVVKSLLKSAYTLFITSTPKNTSGLDREKLRVSSPMERHSTGDIRLDINKKEREREGLSPPLTPKVDNFSFKRVKMSKEKYDYLVKDFGEPKVKEMLERLDEYADINPKRFKIYACHCAVIRKWIREDKEKRIETGGKKTGQEDNMLWAKRVAEAFPGKGIEVWESSLGFVTGTHSFSIGFKEYSFKEQVLNRLNKMGLHYKE